MITVPTADLVGILSDVIPFAWTDVEIPQLNCVRLEWDGNQLHALTTDRYRLGWSTWEPGDVGQGEEVQDDLFTDWGSGDDPWAMTIALDEAKELVKVFKLPPKEGHTPITVDYDASRWTAKIVRSRDTGHSAITVVVPDMREEFPDLRALLAKNDALAAVTNSDYNAKFMADFAKVRPTGALSLKFSEGLTHVSIGERFVGAIMPVKVGQSANAVPGE
jgi:hypothetical protein